MSFGGGDFIFNCAFSGSYDAEKSEFSETKTKIPKSCAYFFYFGILGIFMTAFLLAIFAEKFEMNHIF